MRMLAIGTSLTEFDLVDKWLREGETVVVFGMAGTGKTHLLGHTTPIHRCNTTAKEGPGSGSTLARAPRGRRRKFLSNLI